MNTTTNTVSKWDMVGNTFDIAGSVVELTGWHQPHLLRAGDLIHVDETSLSEVLRTEKHRGGTELIHLADGRQICVCGGTDIAVFAPAAR